MQTQEAEVVAPAEAGDSEFLTQVRELMPEDRAADLDQLIEKHGETPALVDAIVEKDILPKEVACRIWADSLNVAYVEPMASIMTEEALERLPLEVARKACVIPLYLLDGVLTVAMAFPGDQALVRRLGLVAEIPVSPVFALPREIEEAIALFYASEEGVERSLRTLEESGIFAGTEIDDDQLAALAGDNAVVQMLEEIIHVAVRERATDIHMEPQEKRCRMRFRVDGNLREIMTYSYKTHRALVSRLKVMCNLNIAESRFPHDGRFSMKLGSRDANFRVSTMPSAHGEKVVVRVVAMFGKRTMMSLDRMMMSRNVIGPFKRLITNPNGIIFVTGPTGSGKTTTLYAALQEINAPNVNISTIEDPIEVQLPGITQTQINPHIDLKFATVLRGLLRQDPDVILVGEIRDLETAKIATEAALTGHLVFATLHTNSAAQAIVRMTELGVEPYMVAPAVLGVLAQRLVARICDACKEEYHPSKDVLRRYFHEEGLCDVPFYRGRGCPVCKNTGYKGRIALHELVLITDEMRSLISRGGSAQEIARAATKVGFRPTRHDGLKKVLLGLTTIDEVEQNTSVEWAAGLETALPAGMAA